MSATHPLRLARVTANKRPCGHAGVGDRQALQRHHGDPQGRRYAAALYRHRAGNRVDVGEGVQRLHCYRIGQVDEGGEGIRGEGGLGIRAGFAPGARNGKWRDSGYPRFGGIMPVHVIFKDLTPILSYSARAPEALTTLAHLAVSVLIYAANSSGARARMS